MGTCVKLLRSLYMGEREEKAAKRRTARAAISCRLKAFYETLTAYAYKDADGFLQRAQQQSTPREHES
jgi:hypothetical protein